METVLCSDSHAAIRWLLAIEWRGKEVLVVEFPKSVCIVDETKISTLSPYNCRDHQATYDGHHHLPCLSSISWNNIYGVIICVDCTIPGIMYDHTIFSDRDPYHESALFFFPGQNEIGDKRFTGKERHVNFPFKY